MDGLLVYFVSLIYGYSGNPGKLKDPTFENWNLEIIEIFVL